MIKKIIFLLIVILCFSISASAVEEIYQCDLCGFYHSVEDTYFRSERNPNHLQSSWTSDIDYVCKYCIHRLPYPERNLFKQRSLTYEH